MDHLTRCEGVISRSEQTQVAAAKAQIEAGNALKRIRDERLYKTKFKTWDLYLKVRWNWTRQHAQQLIAYAVVGRHLSTTVDILPSCERQARPLTRLTAGQQTTAWKRCLELPEGERTSVAIGKIAAEVRLSPVNGKSNHTAVENKAGNDLLVPLRWYGSKRQLAPTIASLLHEHKTYIEPFAGSLAVLYAKQPSRIEIVNDRHQEVVAFYRVLRNPVQAKELQRLLKLTPYSRDEHAECKANPISADPVETARRFFVRCRQSFSGVLDNTWCVSTLKDQAGAGKNIADSLLDVAERLRSVQIENADFRQIFNRIPDRGGIMVYCDPPYLHSTRTRKGDAYEHEMTDKDHGDLLNVVTGYKRTRVAVSGYDSSMYNEALKKWIRHEWKQKINVTAVSGEDREACERTEVLWRNW